MELSLDTIGVPDRIYDELVSAMGSPTPESLKRVDTILREMDVEKRKRVLTYRTDNHISLICRASDSKSITVLLESFTEKERLALLLDPGIKLYDHDQSTTDLMRNSKVLQAYRRTSAVYFIETLLKMVSPGDCLALKEQRDQRNRTILHILFMSLQQSSYFGPLKNDVVYKCQFRKKDIESIVKDRNRLLQATEFVIKSIDVDCLRVLLLQTEKSSQSPLFSLISQGPYNPCYNKRPQSSHEHHLHVLLGVLRCIPIELIQEVLSTPVDLEGNTLFMYYIEHVYYHSNEQDSGSAGYIFECFYTEGHLDVKEENSCLRFIMNNISRDDRVKLLSQEDQTGSTAMHCIKSLTILLMLCQGLDSATVQSLLCLQDMLTGSTPLEKIFQSDEDQPTRSRQFNNILDLITTEDIKYLFSLNSCALIKKLINDNDPDMMKCLMTSVPEGERLEFLVSHNVFKLGPTASCVLDCLQPKDRSKFLNTTDSSNSTSFHHETPNTIELCLKKVPQESRLSLLMKQDNAGNTALHNASEHCTAILKTLATTADMCKMLSIRNNLGRTVLHILDHGSIMSIFQELNITSADSLLCLQDSLGDTVFHRMESGPKSIVITQLLKHIKEHKRLGVMSKVNNVGETLFHKLDYRLQRLIMALYKELGDTAMYQLLAMKDRNGDTPIHKLCEVYPTLKAVIRRIDINQRLNLLTVQNNNGSTPLHKVAHAKSASAVKCMIEMLPVPNPNNVGDGNNSTPDRVKLLELRDKRGRTALHISIASNDYISIGHMTASLTTLEIRNILSIHTNKGEPTLASGSGIWSLTKLCLAMFQAPERHLILSIVGDEAKPSLTAAGTELDELEYEGIRNTISASTILKLKTEYLWLDGLLFPEGNSVLHHLTKNKDAISLKKVLQALPVEERLKLMARRNTNDKTALELARSYETKHLLEWSHNQKGYYYLPTSPEVVIMYSTIDRDGAEQESEKIMNVFPEFNARISKEENPTRQQMLDAIRLAQLRDDISALVVIIMSHGVQGYVCASDGDLSIQEILLQMCSPSLEGKPKVLLVQACQNRDVNRPSRIRAGIDPGPPRSQPRRIERSSNDNLQHRDVILMMATVSGNLAYRNLMIPMFAEELRDSKDGDIYDIFLTTHDKMREKLKGTPGQDQIPEFRSTLTQKLCLRNIFKEP